MKDNSDNRVVNILGTRGIPVGHSGFETCVLALAPRLRDLGWQVTVYCQSEPRADGQVTADHEDHWRDIRRVHLGSRRSGSAGSIVFDWRSVRHVLGEPGIDLVFGYNTALFTLVQRLAGRKVVINMDGIEWQRAKWSAPIKAWFYLNEFIASHAASVPIADHPEIATHLKRHGCNRSVMIPYGAEPALPGCADILAPFGLSPQNYMLVVARIEPENSILEIVRAFSRSRRGVKLVVLGRLVDGHPYTEALRSAAGQEVVLAGPVYEPERVAALRNNCLAYIHGHQVGGTNPSLVEALAAGAATIAHDNRFNRWVAGDRQAYFKDEEMLVRLIGDAVAGTLPLADMRAAARARHLEAFCWDKVARAYDEVLSECLAR